MFQGFGRFGPLVELRGSGTDKWLVGLIYIVIFYI